MDQLSFGLPTTGSEIHFTWSNGVITLSDKFTGYIRTADGHSIRIEDGNWIYRTFGEPIEHVRLPHPCCPSCGVEEGDVCDPSCDARKVRVAAYMAAKAIMDDDARLPHPCVQDVVTAGEDIAAGQLVQMKGGTDYDGIKYVVRPLNKEAYRCFSIAQDMREALGSRDIVSGNYVEAVRMDGSPFKDEEVSCKCVSLLHGHESGCPIQGK